MDQPNSPDQLRRVLGSWDAAALMVGVIIGSGIFATPPLVADHLPMAGGILAVWTLGGVLALCGALSYAELTGMFPYTGGSYAFLRESYGRLPAFSYGWSALLVTYPASIAGVALVFAAYLSHLIPVPEGGEPIVAAALCLGLAGVNILGVRLGAGILRVFTAAKVLALLLIAVAAGVTLRGSWNNLKPWWRAPDADWSLAPAALALVAVLWTYEGWADGPSLAGEMKNRGMDVARALLLSTVLVTVVYLAVNVGYLSVLGIEGVRNTDSVAVDTAREVFGASGTGFVSLLVVVSTLGAALGMTLGASRVFYAMGRDGLFLAWVGRVHPRRGTPVGALVTIGSISGLYALIGTFEAVIRYFVFVATIWFILNIASVLVHRVRHPDHPRPFRVPLYPLPPVIYLLVAGTLLAQLVVENPGDALIGAMVLIASLPAYRLWSALGGRRPPPPPSR